MNKYEKALKSLKAKIKTWDHYNDCPMSNGYYKNTNYQIALLRELVEKEISKKPDYEGDGYADGYMVYDTWICPNCGKKYEVDYQEYNRCPECGQLIDWSRKNE